MTGSIVIIMLKRQRPHFCFLSSPRVILFLVFFGCILLIIMNIIIASSSVVDLHCIVLNCIVLYDDFIKVISSIVFMVYGLCMIKHHHHRYYIVVLLVWFGLLCIMYKSKCVIVILIILILYRVYRVNSKHNA